MSALLAYPDTGLLPCNPENSAEVKRRVVKGSPPYAMDQGRLRHVNHVLTSHLTALPVGSQRSRCPEHHQIRSVAVDFSSEGDLRDELVDLVGYSYRGERCPGFPYSLPQGFFFIFPVGKELLRVYISFAARPIGASAPNSEESQAAEAAFAPTAASNAKKRLATTRPGQGKFRFDVLKRYGPLCAVCDQSIPELLEAAHIVAKEFAGCDDPRNGLVLCRNHHRALDKGFFLIEPASLRVTTGPRWSIRDLGIIRETIRHLPALPAREALDIVYREKGR
jgi:hypothetical protein